jgi:hypothetical protein
MNFFLGKETDQRISTFEDSKFHNPPSQVSVEYKKDFLNTKGFKALVYGDEDKGNFYFNRRQKSEEFRKSTEKIRLEKKRKINLISSISMRQAPKTSKDNNNDEIIQK